MLKHQAIPSSMKHEGSLPCSQETTTGPYSEQDKSPQPLSLFL